MYMHSGCGLIHNKPFDVCVRVGGGGGGGSTSRLPTRCETVCGSNSPVILDFSSKKTYRAEFFREASKCNKVLPVKSPQKYMQWQMRKTQNSLYLFVFIEIRI